MTAKMTKIKLHKENADDRVSEIDKKRQQTMTAKQEKKQEQSIKLALPSNGYRLSTHFNTYCISALDDLYLMQFALVIGGRVLSLATCSIESVHLAKSRSQLLDYVARASTPAAEFPPWLLEPVNCVHEVKVINASHSGGSAELTMCTFSMQAAFKHANNKAAGELPVDAVARVCSSTPLQVRFILELCGLLKD